MTWLREFRLIPIAVAAVAGLLVLKVAGIVIDGGYTLGERLSRSNEQIVVTTVPASTAVKLRSETVPLDLATAQPGKPWAQEVLNYPEVTGSVSPAKPPPVAAPSAKPAEPPAAKPPETQPAATAPPAERPISAVERAVLERLQERRQQLDARARELDMRESLLKAAEQKLQQPAQVAQNDVPAPRPDEAEINRFKALVTMYETMKPKDAAKIFDRLDIKVLIEMSTMINPRAMSAILAQMTPEAAEKLTVELARRARNPSGPPNPAELPKIEGKPTGS